MSGNQHHAASVEVMELTSASIRDRQKHQEMLIDLEAKKRAFEVDVPTLPKDVRTALRDLGLPVRLFGENLANVRDRLRHELARRQVIQEKQGGVIGGEGDPFHGDSAAAAAAASRRQEQEEEQVTKYSRAAQGLISARERISRFSFQRSKHRLDKERSYRLQWERKRAHMKSRLHDDKGEEDNKQVSNENEFAEIEKIDQDCVSCYKRLRKLGLEGSQYADTRPLSSIATSLRPVAGFPLVTTGSWSGTVQIWDGSSPELTSLGKKSMAHEDRIMGIAVNNGPLGEENESDSAIIATASIDLTAKLWKIQKKDAVMSDEGAMDTNAPDDNDGSNDVLAIEEMAHLKGHAARLCSVAFHPQGDYVGTTSFDHTWRLWDVETGSEVLLQDGHWKEVYGIGFHPDGSLCSTTDYGGVVQVWDLRSGKSACHFVGHAKRVVCTEFAPNGFQLATAGDDGTIKIWDLRKRKQFASIPAHLNLITQLKFDPANHNGGEYLVSSSFDGTAKVWSARDWKMLATLRGHQGKVMGVGVLKDNVVTSGFDKTLKLWR